MRYGQFRYQFGAQSISVLGSALSPVALSLGLLDSGRSASDLGLVLAANTVPMVLFVLVGGVIADRLPRHGLMVVTNLIRAATQTGVVLSLRLEPGRPILAARLLELLQVPLMVAVAFDAGLPVLAAAAVTCGVGLTFPDTLWFTTMQRQLSEESISRISSYDWMGSLALRPVAYAGAAALSSRVGLAETLCVAAALILCTRILGSALPGVRALRTIPEAPQAQAAALTEAVS